MFSDREEAINLGQEKEQGNDHQIADSGQTAGIDIDHELMHIDERLISSLNLIQSPKNNQLKTRKTDLKFKTKEDKKRTPREKREYLY